jgi:glutamate/tyrosine decarboxylase-like PLP-dependent enzyme
MPRMAAPDREYDRALDRAADEAKRWLRTLPERPVPPARDVDAMLETFDRPLPDWPDDPVAVVDELATSMDGGLMAIGSGRFYGWVMGGTLPAALAADWMVSAWDQNTGMRFPTPGTAAVETVAARWLLDLLGLPQTCDVGFTTGGTMANFVGLAAGRQAVLERAGWDLDREGLAGGPRLRILAGEDRHSSIDLALRYCGLGAPTPVAADDQGRVRLEALADALGALAPGTPTIVCLAAGNLHSGAFEDLGEATRIAHEHGAWVHVDGAFGLWAGASPTHRHLVAGYEHADSWATDAHKTLNVPFDCGVAIVADRRAVRGALEAHASYFVNPSSLENPPDPFAVVPELSRRARGVPVWAALRSLGRSGVADLVDGMVSAAQGIASGIASIEGAEVLNDVVYTQVSASFGSDERTRGVTERLLADGTAWMSGSRWRGREVLRVSVSNWTTDADDVARSVDAVRRAAAAAG